MQNIIIDKPYRFVRPSRSRIWPFIIPRFKPFTPYLKKNYGLESHEVRGLERLQASVRAGHGVLLAPNHSRPCDPLVMVWIGLLAGLPTYTMASWHLFRQTRVNTWMLTHMGAFSMYREGLDRESLKFAVQALTAAERPVITYPEGVVTRTNDRLNNLMEGVAFLARTAARQRAAKNPPGRVVIHPVALRYFYRGDLQATLTPVLETIEQRLSWRPQRHLSLPDRIIKIGDALLTLKEIEHFGKPRTQAGLHQRRLALIDRLLVPLEDEYLKGRREGDVVSRVKNIRSAIVPEMASGAIDETERARRWEQLADTYLAQQAHFYPADYFDTPPTPEQLLETVEKFEEDLTDKFTVHRPLHLVAEVGEAIEVNPVRERGEDGDPLMIRLRAELFGMLTRLKQERSSSQA